MLNSSSSIWPSLESQIQPLKYGQCWSYDVNQFSYFLSFCWYFLVSTEIIPLAIAPIIDAAPNAVLTGILMNVGNVAILDIQVAMLILLEQAFNHVSRFSILLYFLYFFLNIFSLATNPCLLALITLR